MMQTSGGDVRLILAMAGVVALLFLKGLPAGLPPVDHDPAPGAFNTPRALERLERILGDQRPHPAGSSANDAVRARLIAEIKALGFAPAVRDDFTCNRLRKAARVVCARVRNVVFRAGPRSGKAVMVAAHYDSVPAGPGAADDGLGIAVSLELAAELAAAPPEKPVVFLLTDGEELGLLGAHSFVETDPLAEDIESVINIEARGVRGPGLMFETSVPNGRDVFSYLKGAARPFANSMMTDIYRLLPNDTDVSEFLPKGYDAVNLALTEGVEFYHTPHDNLHNLDPKSVQHVGRSALRSLRNFLHTNESGGEREYAFFDILSRFSVIAPQWLGGLAAAFGALGAGIAFVQAGGGRPVSALAAPPLIIVAAGALALALRTIVGAMRPEAFYWMAHPDALRAVAYLSAVLAALVGYRFLAAGVSRARLSHAGWLWFALIGAGLFAVVPGATILFAAPAFFYAAGALLTPRALTPYSYLPAALALIIFLPALYFAEIGLGLAAAPAFAVVTALLAVIVAPLALVDKARVGTAPIAAAGIALALSTGAALVVPAYSAAKPVPMNIDYFIDADHRSGQWLIASPESEVPAAMQAQAEFKPADIAGLGEAMPAAHAPYLETWPPEVMVLADEPDGDGRRLKLELVTDGAEAISLHIPKEAKAISVASDGRVTAFSGDGDQTLYCIGPECNEKIIDIRLGARASTDWYVFGLRFGLPRAAQPIVAARPHWATPIQSGDVSIVRKKINI